MMTIELILSGFAVFIAVISLIYTSWSAKRQEYLNALANNISQLSNVELMIADNPKILELHGVSIKDLEDIGVSEKEFAYLLANFSNGGLYYRGLSKATKGPFTPNTYRYNLLKSSETRKMWPLLKNFFEPSPYINKIDETINLIESEETEEEKKNHNDK